MPTDLPDEPDAHASGPPPASPVPLAALRRLRRAPAAAKSVEHCDLCGEALAAEHRHLLDASRQALVCACPACVLLFDRAGAAGGKYRAIPTRTLALDDFQLSEEQWDELLIPVGMAFVYRSTPAGRAVAYYPSPAGATESLLSLESWKELVAANPVLEELEPDVQALLINRVRGASEYYLVPIDACYSLVGLIRLHWKGLSGGEQVWTALDEFFGDLRARARRVRATKGAPDAGPTI